MAMAEMTRVQPFEDSTGLLSDPDLLRQRAVDQGYLFLRGRLPINRVLELRRAILELCQRHGWLDEKAGLMDGVCRPGLIVQESPDPRWVAFYRDVLALRAFHALAMDPALLGAYERLFGEPVLPHSRNICRVMFPGLSEYTTPPHQDHLYIGGTEDTWTAWIPLGDCPRELGGLALIPGSHRCGFLEARAGKGAGGQQVDVPDDAPWSWSPMAAGDVLLFHSLTVHQALDHRSPDRLRLSVDFRCQPLSRPVRRDSMDPHMAGFGLTWETLYAGWPPDDPLRYYWRDWNLRYADR